MLIRILVLMAVTSLAASCSPSVGAPGVTVHVPDVVPDTLRPKPQVHVFYSDLDRYALAREVSTAAEVAHPNYEVSNVSQGVGYVRFEREELARTYVRALSNGRTALLLYPEDLQAERDLQLVIDILEASGSLTDSGLPELEPVPVDSVTIGTSGELFRYYSGVTEGQLGRAALDCRSDYLIASDQGGIGSFGLDETAMPDGRVRLYVNVNDSGQRTLAAIEETRILIGLMFACLDLRVGAGQEA